MSRALVPYLLGWYKYFKSVLTRDPGSEGAARNVFVVIPHQNVVIAGQRGQIRDCAGSILIVEAADLGLGRTFDGQVQSTWPKGIMHIYLEKKKVKATRCRIWTLQD